MYGDRYNDNLDNRENGDKLFDCRLGQPRVCNEAKPIVSIVSIVVIYDMTGTGHSMYINNFMNGVSR